MKINEYNGMMKWLTRHKAEATIKKAVNPEGKPMKITDYITKMNYLYGNGNEDDPDTPSQMNPKYIDPLELQKLKESIPVSPMVKQPKKIIKKEIKVVEKLVKPKSLVPEWDWRLGDWTDLFDEDTPMPPPEDIEKVLNIKKKEVAGLESLLRLHKFVGWQPLVLGALLTINTF